jgi:hypothetical protein
MHDTADGVGYPVALGDKLRDDAGWLHPLTVGCPAFVRRGEGVSAFDFADYCCDVHGGRV